jgi:hypothetical protein
MGNASVLVDIENRMKMHWPDANFVFTYTSSGKKLIVNEPRWFGAGQQYCAVSRTIATFDDQDVPYLLIDQIYLDPVYRRVGMGSLLLKLWLISAQADGITRARCNPSTDQGRALASRAGFRPRDPTSLGGGDWVLEIG